MKATRPRLSYIPRSSKRPVCANDDRKFEGPETNRLVEVLFIGHLGPHLSVKPLVSTRSNLRNAKPEAAFGEGGRMFSTIFQ